MIRGNTAQGAWEERLDVPPVLPGEGREAIPTLWAREAIEDLELDLACGGERTEIDPRIEQIALRYSVSSRLTSWVAIAEERSVDPRDPVRVERLPQALPYGMSAEGIGLRVAASQVSANLVVPSASLLGLMARRVGNGRRLELERDFELGAGLGEIRNIARDGIERLRHLVEAVEELTNLWRPEPGISAKEIRARGLELLARLESLAHEAHKLPVSIAGRLSEMRDMLKRMPVLEQVSLRGRVLPTPGRPTTTVEMIVTSGFDWQPATTATIAGRPIEIVEQGTTRPGPIVAGTLIRVELDIAPALLVQASTIELECGADVLVVAIAAAD